jgi:pimeloyl-ACP methyl ester carboxylesterase
METTEVGGLRITYERAGTGPPLVLLHGYVGDARATWHHQLDDLSDEFMVIAWDAPGAGGSSDPPESFGTAGYADALAGFVAALGLDTPTSSASPSAASSPWPCTAATPASRGR